MPELTPVPEGTISWAITTTGGSVAMPRKPAAAAARSPIGAFGGDPDREQMGRHRP